MVEHDQQPRSAGGRTREQIVQRGVLKRGRDRDDALMGFERQSIEEGALLETHRNVAFFGRRQQRTQRGILLTVGCDVNDAQRLAGGDGLVDRVDSVNQIVKVESFSTGDMGATAFP
jgi:hypothetical protein